MRMATKLDRTVTWKASNHKATERPDDAVLQSHVTNENHYISTIRVRVPMATKLGRMVAHLDELLPTVSWPFDHMILWDDVTNLNHYISAITMPMATKLGRIVTYFERLLKLKSRNAFTRSLTKSRDKRKFLYLYYQSANGHQTC